jgi:hypothetical protein
MGKTTKAIDMIKCERFKCADKYEAEKLASLTRLQKNHSTYIHDISDVIGDEIVVVLKDRSSHCIIMKDNATAVRLKLLLSEVLRGKKTISNGSYKDDITELVISE